MDAEPVVDAEPDADDRRRRAEDETAARKRARRVSFADTTAVHVFDRDEDLETPPDSRPPASLEDGADPREAGFSGVGEEGRVEEEEEEEVEEDEAELIVKGVLDFSPGSAAGSVTSNDDENLFGPVSTSFINSGHMSEASEDDNHDITLDSTAFSLHFRNVLPLEDRSGFSAGSFRTPTEELMPDDHESAMSLTRGKKNFSQLRPNEISGDGTSNSSRMSVVTETSRKYDYGKLSPGLEALLLKVNESIQMETPDKRSTTNQVDMLLGQQNIEATSPANTPVGATANGIPTSTSDQLYTATAVNNEFNMFPLGTSNTCLPSSPNQGACISSEKDASPNHFGGKKALGQSKSISSPLSTFNLPGLIAPNARQQPPELLELGTQTPYAVQGMKLPLEGSVSSLSKKRQEVFLSPISLQNQHVSMLSRSKSPCSKTSAGRDIRKTLGNKNETPSFKGDDLLVVDTVISGSPQRVTHLETGVVSGKEGKSMDIPSIATSGMFSGTEIEHMKNDGLETSRLKIGFEISHQGLLTPVNAKKLASPSGHNMVATPEASKGFTDQMATASRGLGGLSATNIKRPTIFGKGFMPQSTCRLGLGTTEDQQGLLAIQKLLSPSHAELFVKKRKYEEVHLKDGNPRGETVRNKKSLEVVPHLKARSSEVSAQGHNVISEVGNTKLAMPAKCWKDILAKVSAVASQPFSSSIGLLNLKEIDIFNDMLDSWQMNRKYKSLCVDIQSAGKNYHADYKHRERVTEAKFLQDVLLYKRVKLMLMHAKRDVLLKNSEKIHSGIQECHKIRTFLNVKKHSDWGSALKHVSTYPDIRGLEAETTITLKKEELGALEKKLMGLIQFFEDFCKLKGNGDVDALISLVLDYLNKRRRCRDIRRNLLLWIVDDVVIKKDGCVIVLNYCDILSQSFSINSLGGSVISFRNSLRDVNIEKRFPNMKAYAAFSFVFSNMIEHKLADSKYLRKVTQMTSFLLGNMLDLLEEVQEVRLVIPNLVRTVFDPSSASKLGLDLCFHGRRKLTLTLDVSDLKCGIYPSEPSELHVQITESQINASSFTLDEIMSAIKRLQGGRLMIKRLCKCVSDIIGSLP